MYCRADRSGLVPVCLSGVTAEPDGSYKKRMEEPLARGSSMIYRLCYDH